MMDLASDGGGSLFFCGHGKKYGMLNSMFYDSRESILMLCIHVSLYRIPSPFRPPSHLMACSRWILL